MQRMWTSTKETIGASIFFSQVFHKKKERFVKKYKYSIWEMSNRKEIVLSLLVFEYSMLNKSLPPT